MGMQLDKCPTGRGRAGGGGNPRTGEGGSAGTLRSDNAAFRQKGEGRALQMVGRELEGQRLGR